MRRFSALSVRVALGGAFVALAFFLVSAAAADPPPTFVVNTAADTAVGSCTPTLCSLRDAISAADGTPGGATIHFAVPGSGVPTIKLDTDLGALPNITAPVTIDGTSQPNTSGAFGVAIDGSGLPGLLLAQQGSGGSTIRGLALGSFNGPGQTDSAIEVDSGGNTIAGDSIGIAADGSASGNENGIFLRGSSNTIGGSTAADRNVIVSSGGDGILVEGNGDNFLAAGNAILGNYVGVLGDGTTVAGNEDSDIQVVNADGTQIGGPDAADGNVLAGAGLPDAIFLGDFADTNGSGTTVRNNLIGLTADGSASLFPLGVSGNGIDVDDEGSNTIADNTIADMYQGVDICDSPGNTVVHNVIGSNTANPGGPDFGVHDQGISVENGFCQQVGSATGNTIGGAPGKGNVVVGSQLNDLDLDADQNTASYNTLRGTKGGAAVQVAGNGNMLANNTITGATTGGTEGSPIPGNGVEVDSGSANNLGRNSIHGNQSLGIDLASGANDDQAAPVLDTASFTGGDLQFTGHYDFPTGAGYEIDIYQSLGPCSSGNVQGAHFAGAFLVDSGGDGVQTFSHTAVNDQLPGGAITATATAPDGSTSEFSSCLDASGTAPSVYVVNTSVDSDDGGQCTDDLCSLRDAINAADETPGGATIEFDIPGAAVAPTISLGSLLPAITAPVTIDGTTQPGTPANTPGVTLVDGGAHGGIDLAPGSDGSTVDGLAFGGFGEFFPGSALRVESDHDVITGNWIGIGPDSSSLGSSNVGIQVSGNNDVIGGGAAGAPNTIEGTDTGILVGQVGGGIPALDNTVQGNLLEGNFTGVYLGGATSTVIGNNDDPSALADVQAHPAFGNVISGRGQGSTAIAITDGTTGTIAAGNFIGVDRAGNATVALDDGIDIESPANQIGPGNVIAHSLHDGVFVLNDGDEMIGISNRIVANSIFDSGQLGIELQQEGNNNEPAPVISAVNGGTITGTVATKPGHTVFVEIFTNPTCDPPYSTGAGRTYIDSVTTGSGAWSIDVAGLAVGEGVTATATDTNTTDTSEFSNCVEAAAAGTLSGSLSESIVKPVDLTAAGSTDWALWGEGSSGDQPPSALTPNDFKANGDRQVSDLTITPDDGSPTRGFGSFTGDLVPFNFAWSDGTPIASASTVYGGLSAPEVGEGLSFTVPARTTPQTLTLWTSAHYADGTLTAHLSDDSAPDYVQTLHAVQGDFTQTGENVPGIFTIQFQAAGPGQHLTVTWNQDTNNGCDGCDDIVLYGAALSAGGNAASASASLTSDEAVPMAAADVPIADIPLFAFEAPPPGNPPLQLNGLQLNGLQLNGLQLNGLQLNGLQLNGLQLNGLQLNGLQLNGLQLNGLQLHGLQLNGLQLNGLQLNGLPLLDTTDYPNGWQGILAGTSLAGKPLQTVTLDQVLGLNPQPAVLVQHPLTLGDLDLSGSALGQETLGSLALAGFQLNGLPAGYQNAIFSGLHDWCVAHVPNPATACLPSGTLGTATLFGLALAGAPVQGLQLNGLQLNGLQLNGLQLNGLQLNGLSTSASSIGGLQLNGLQLNGLPLGNLQLNGLPLDVLHIVCTSSGFSCATGTLGQAQAAGAINPNATVGNLDGHFNGFTIGDLLQSLLGPSSIYKNTATFGDLIGLLIRRADVPWESLSPETLSLFDKNRPKMNMSAHFTVQGAGMPAGDVSMKIPDGFDYDPGSAKLSEGGGEPQPQGDPSIDGQTLDWHFGGLDPDVPYTLTFMVRSGTNVGPAQATETVTSGGSSDSSTVAFSVTDSFPGNDQPGEAAGLTPNEGVQLSALPAPGDVDYYTIPMPAAGTRIHVHLTDLPADYDLALYSPTTTTVRTGDPFGAQQAPLQDGVVPDTQINLGGASNGPLTPTPLEDVPDPGIPVVQVSDNRGLNEEDVGMVSPGGGGVVTIAVFGYNGAFSPQPYSLRVTTQSPPPTQTCNARTFPFATGTTPDSLPSLTSLPSNLNTVILVDEKRLGNTYGANPESTALAKLRHLATSDATLGVSGVLVPVEAIPGVASLYSAWDANPCNPNSANAVANAIANYVDQLKQHATGLKYVVFGGGDDQIPFFRSPDLSLIANESGFASQFGPNEYEGSLAAGDLLTDDPYLDTRPIPAGGRQLFVPDLVGGRLVETAGDIANAVTAFENAKGILKSSTAFVSGYDFVSDSSAQIASELSSSLGSGNVRTLPNPLDPTGIASWTATNLLAATFPNTGAAAINDWNGHFDNTRTQAADGTSLISTSQLTGRNAFNGGIFFTMGCHAGFQTTDAVIGSSVLDWPQYFAQHNTGFVGNTGFGIGSTDSIGFSEELMSDFAANLNGSLSLGDALTQAKDQYFLSRVAFSSYDEKALSEAELYGLPMYGVGSAPRSLMAAAALLPNAVRGTSSSTSPSDGPLSPFTTGVQTASFAAQPNFGLVQHGKDGDFYTNDGLVQAPNYRPLQPYVSLPATRSDGVAHGVVIDGLTSDDHSGFNPDNVRPTLDLSKNEPEPQFTDETWPEKIPTLVSLGAGPTQSLNLITGQFFTDSNGGGGTERLWTQLSGRVTYSTSSDFVPPTIDSIDAFQPTGQGTVVFTGQFSDLDQSGGPGTVKFAQVVLDDGSGHWNAVPLQLSPTSTQGTYTGSGVAPFTSTNPVQFFVEVCDAAGNCGYSSNKGRYFDAEPLVSSTGTPGAITLTPSGAQGTGPWFTGDVGVTATSTGGAVSVSVDGGSFVSPGAVAITGDGPHVVEARDADGNTKTTAVLIDTTPPTSPAFHGVTDGATYTPGSVPTNVTCTAADLTSGLAGCEVSGDNGTGVGDHTLIATATDNAGNQRTSQLTYHVVAGTPPTITSANSASFTSGTAGTFTVTTTGNPTPQLTNQSFGTCTRTPLPSTNTITFTDSGNGTATIAVAAGAAANTYTLCIVASNGVGADATQRFTLTVGSGAATFAGITFANTVPSGNGKVPDCSTTNPFKTGTNDVNTFPNAICSSDGNAPAPSTFSWAVELGNGTPQNATPVVNTGAAIRVTVKAILTHGTRNGQKPSLVGDTGATVTIPTGSAVSSSRFQVQNIGNGDWIQVTVQVDLGGGKKYTLMLQVH